MKRILLWAAVVLVMAATVGVVLLIRLTCIFGNHTFAVPTCTEPETCTRCGETRGEPLGHLYGEASCTEPSVCLRCKEPHGEALGHVYLPATCTEPATCLRCGEKDGEPLGHVMSEPTYQTRPACTRCGYVEGGTLPAALSERTLNELSVGEPKPYTTASYEDRDVDVTGTVEIADYRVFDGDKNFPAREGYEWHVATVRLVFSGKDAQKNGMQSALTFGDYYILDNSIAADADKDGLRPFVADWYGNRVQCWQKTGGNEEGDWFGQELRFTWTEGVLVPKGYDGVLLIFYNFRLAKDATRLFLPASAVLDDNALVFRMK